MTDKIEDPADEGHYAGREIHGVELRKRPFKGFNKDRGFHSSDAHEAASSLKEHEQSHWKKG